MSEFAGRLCLLNGNIEAIENYHLLCEDIKFEVYEVVRIIKGVPLFCNDHFERMTSSLKQLNKEFHINVLEFENQIKLLAEVNKVLNGNVKISIGEQSKNIVLHFIPHYYPSEAEYRQGVKTGFYYAERTNPNVKMHLADLRKNVNEYLNNTGLFEVFYVDRNNEITEGSRTNVFFIRDEKVYTCAPEKVLLGITRQKAIECLKKLDIPLIETNILKDDIGSFDSVFLTGTSPKILPVASIDETTFTCDNITLTRLRNEYDQMIEDYMHSKLK